MTIAWVLGIACGIMLITMIVIVFRKSGANPYIQSDITNQALMNTEDNRLSRFVSDACKSKCSLAVNWKLTPKIIDMVTEEFTKKHSGITVTLDDIRRGVKIKCNKCKFSDKDILDTLYYLENVGGYITNSRKFGSLDKGLCPSCGDNKAYITVSPTNIIRIN